MLQEQDLVLKCGHSPGRDAELVHLDMYDS